MLLSKDEWKRQARSFTWLLWEMKVEILYKIDEIVKHSFSDMKFKIIWYNIIKSLWIKYVCLQENSVDYVYMLEVELQRLSKDKIWFICLRNKKW
jgi:hypothetical protein